MRLLTTSVYAVLATVLAPLARIYLLKRSLKQPAYREHWDERFARCSYPAPNGPRLWLHAVSVGETVAAKPIIEAFLQEFPESEILLTCMTPTGRDAGASISAAHPGRIVQCYLPYDKPSYAARFLDETKPRLGVFMETEVWPNILLAARKRSIPMVLANARESEKSQIRARKAIRIMRPAFASFTAVLAQNKADAIRLSSLGARNTEVTGSVKFDIRPELSMVLAAKSLKKGLGRDILLVASTRKGEEEMLIPPLMHLPENVLIVLVPRHPERFDEIAQLLAGEGISFQRRSRLRRNSPSAIPGCGAAASPALQDGPNPAAPDISQKTRVLLGDTMGEMSFYCALADLCIMGGSFGGTGCQNLIEPAAAGVPVIVGPSIFNFAQAVEDAVRIGGALRVEEPEQAVKTAAALFSDRRELARMSAAAVRFADSYTGSTEKTMACLRKIWRQEVFRYRDQPDGKP